MTDEKEAPVAVTGDPGGNAPRGTPGPEPGPVPGGEGPAPETPTGRGGSGWRFFRRALTVLVLGGAAWATLWMLKHRPAARRRPPKPKATLVEVGPARVGPARVTVSAMGLVRPAREVDLRARVQGEVRWIHPSLEPGGVVRRGEVLLRLDSDDYRLAVKQAEATLAQAKAALAVERGRQAIARREYALLGPGAKDANRALVLREPQLRTAEAAVATAEAALTKARLDLDRTSLRAPFGAVVLSRGVDRGSRVTEATSLCKLVGTDTYWVELVVPVDELRWIAIPGAKASAPRGPGGGAPAAPAPPGAAVTITDPFGWGQGVSRLGRVIQLAPDLEEKGRLARVLVAVSDPLAKEAAHAGLPPLLLGSYVQAEIAGRELPRVAVLERRWLREGGTVWIVSAESRLEIRPVGIAHRGRDRVLVSSGIAAGDRVVTSDLVAATPRMLLKVVAPRRAAAGPPPRRAAGGTP